MIARLQKQSFQVSILLLLGAFIAFPQAVLADRIKKQTEQVDAVLLLDASGSMRITDPNRLRAEGVKLFIQFLKKSDRFALVEFAEKSKTLRPLLGYNEAQEANVNQAIYNLGDAGEYTNFIGAFQTAQKLLAAEGREDAEQVVIFLSDGKLDHTPETGTIEAQRKQLFEEVIPSFKDSEIKIYTLAFSDEVDTELLEEIASSTGGAHWFTPTAEKVHESFADLFLVVKKPQMVPLTSKGFRIDQEIQEATFYINRQEGDEVVLISPASEKLSLNTKRKGFRWFPGQQFDVITIEDPEAGQWQISGIPKNEGFATVLTNLKLLTSWPTVIRAGETTVLEARLYESSKPVVLPEMTDVIKYAFEITPTDKVSEPVMRALLSDDGQDGDRAARDGIFSARVTLEEAGEYNLRVLASAPTFERHQKISFRVKPRLVSLGIIASEHSLSAKNAFDPNVSLAKDFFQLELSPELSGSKRIQVDLFATDKKNRRYKIPLTRFENTYEASSLKLPFEGEYQLYATVTADGRRTKKFRGRSQEISYAKEQVVDEKGNVVSVLLVEEEKKPKEEPQGFPWVYFVLLVVMNGGAGYACLNKLKEKQASMSDESIESFNDIAPIEAALVELEQRSKSTEIDFDDPIFTNDEIEVMPDLKNILANPEAKPEPDPISAPAVDDVADDSEASEVDDGSEMEDVLEGAEDVDAEDDEERD